MRKRCDPKIVEKYKNKLVLNWAGKIWMDNNLTCDYLHRVLGQSLFGNRLIVWDSFRCHTSEETKKELRKLGLHSAIIPGGTTKFIQAPDVSWNGPFKSKLQELFNNWMLNGAEMEWTVNGNPKPPAIDVYLNWICVAWDSITNKAISKSFKDCGITICPDGNEDDEIHCFKAHGAVPEGREILRKLRSTEVSEQIETDEFYENESEIGEENIYSSDASLEF
ncbi:hypothetical protein ACQ4LE_002664 [Meloidogyne hapla]